MVPWLPGPWPRTLSTAWVALTTLPRWRREFKFYGDCINIRKGSHRHCIHPRSDEERQRIPPTYNQPKSAALSPGAESGDPGRSKNLNRLGAQLLSTAEANAKTLGGPCPPPQGRRLLTRLRELTRPSVELGLHKFVIHRTRGMAVRLSSH